VGRSRKKIGYRADRKYYYGIFDSENGRVRHFLINESDLIVKTTQRGRVARSLLEKDILLEQLWLKKLKELETKEKAVAQPPTKSIRQVFQIYLKIQTPLLSKNSIIHLKASLCPFVEMFGDQEAIDLNIDLISKFTAFLKAKQLRPITINSYLIQLGTWLNWLVEQGIILKRPKIKRLKYTKKNPTIYSVEDCKKIESYISRKIKEGGRYQKRWALVFRFFMLARYTGARGGELVHLKWEQINLIEKTITIKETENQQVKGGEERVVQIGSVLYQYLMSLQRQAEGHFLKSEGVSPFWSELDPITRTFKKINKELGILQDPSPTHGFRYTLATELLTKGVPLVDVQKILGHKKIETTMIYFNNTQLETKDAMELVGE
jgi:integrase